LDRRLLLLSLVCVLGASAARAQGPGFPNVPRTKGQLIAGPLVPSIGRASVIAYHQGFVIVNPESPESAPGSDLLSRAFDLSNPSNPTSTVIPFLRVNSMIGSHGYWYEGSYLRGFAPGDMTVELVGGVPQNFGLSARLGRPGGSFVIEADEYDTAYFDKRSKFLHYPARTTVLNNLEFDHADIFPDLAAIETQFHHFVRTLPASGLIVANGADEALARVLERGCYTPVERFGGLEGWTAVAQHADGFEVRWKGESQGRVSWMHTGAHNQSNALAAIAAARHCGVAPAQSIAALSTFEGVKRRMEVRGVVGGVTVYDDFAHHPTAIESTIAGLRAKVDGERIVAVIEPRSNTMRRGLMKDRLAASLASADCVFCYSAGLKWDAAAALASLGAKAVVMDDLRQLVENIAAGSRRGDHVLVMSNGDFGGLWGKLLARLAR